MGATCGGDGEPTRLLASEQNRVAVGDEMEIHLSAEPGLGDAWQVATPPDETVVRQYPEPFFTRTVTLPSGPAAQSACERFLLPTDGSLVAGYYVYEVFFTRPGGSRTLLPPESVPQPTAAKQPVLEITADEPAISGHALYGLSEEGRAWGLCSDAID